DVEAFERQIYRSAAQHWKAGDRLLTPDQWAAEAVVGMKAALVNPKRTDTIGGLVQAVIITREGIRAPGLKWVVEGGDPMKESDYEALTTPPYRVAGWPRSTVGIASESGLITRQVIR